jgi:hypothetical protein
VLLDEALNVGATIHQFPVEHAWRELRLDLRAPMAVGNASVVSGFLDGEIVFAGEHHIASSTVRREAVMRQSMPLLATFPMRV